ncbi:MAG: isocitrate lyase/phosphoenolpyruvate mutase family protein [Kiloniellales bacterium]|jgi:2-methylisocitrate lyase-like PEP mutase family enzyme
MATQQEKAQTFRALHEREGAFVIPNPWDIGSARLFEALGFEALATTSSGFAYSLGRRDGQVSREEKLTHCRALCEASSLPVSADLEKCFSDDPKEAAETIALGAEAGLVGGSIEDATGDPTKPIYDFNHAVERVAAAAQVAKSLDTPFVLTARAENFLHGRRDMNDTIRRLQAFEAAGADVLYAPGPATLDEAREITSALTRPVNMLVTPMKGVTVADLAQAGVKRISIGGAMMRAVIGTLVRGSRQMLDEGRFDWGADMMPTPEINELFSKWES